MDSQSADLVEQAEDFAVQAWTRSNLKRNIDEAPPESIIVVMFWNPHKSFEFAVSSHPAACVHDSDVLQMARMLDRRVLDEEEYKQRHDDPPTQDCGA